MKLDLKFSNRRNFNARYVLRELEQLTLQPKKKQQAAAGELLRALSEACHKISHMERVMNDVHEDVGRAASRMEHFKSYSKSKP